MDVAFVGDFLDHLEKERGNGARSRNTRLAAIRSFFHYVSFQEPAHGSGRQWGFYLQPVTEVLPRIYAIARYEYYKRAAPDPAINIGVLGLAYKPWPFVVLKGEYLFADHRAAQSPPGVKTSFTVLF